MRARAFLIVYAMTVTPALAVEYQISCTFGSASNLLNDPIVKDWNKAAHLKTREYIVEVDPPKIIEPTDKDTLWRDGKISTTAKDITLTFDMFINPIRRRPRAIVTINRFSGAAFENFLMLEKEDTGPEYSYAGRDGQCEIHPKRL